MSKPKPRPNNVARLLLGLVVAILLVALVGAGALAVSAQAFRRSDAIAQNVTIAGVALGGLPRGEALTRLESDWAPRLPEKVTLVVSEEEFPYTREELGAELQLAAAVDEAMRLGREGGVIKQVTDRVRLMRSSVDIPVQVKLAEAPTRARLAEVAARVNRPPVDARITLTGEESVEVVPGKPGLALDEKTSAKAIAAALRQPTTDRVELTTAEKQPNITTADLAHLEVVLGSFSTPYSARKVDRTHNLHLAVKAITGKVVAPGEEFSANAAIGPRDAERGFREAPIFVNGEITPSTGGGVCQIATTVYNAALLAGLPVRERHHHSMPVTYADAGRDATVYWGQCDLRFSNDTGSAIVVLASLSGSRVHVRLIGKREAKKKVRVERSGITGIPFEITQKPDPTLDLGKKKVEEKGRKGIRVTVHRITENPDGTEKRELLHTDTYRPYKQVELIGAKKPVVPPGGILPPSVGANGKAAVTPPLKPGAKPAAAKPPGEAKTPPVKPAKPAPRPQPGKPAAGNR